MDLRGSTLTRYSTWCKIANAGYISPRIFKESIADFLEMMGGDTAMAARIDRKPSIEFEPRTLTMDQIQFAREAALYVMNTRTMEAALSVFTEGLEPVVGVARGNGSAVNWMEMMSEEEEEQYLENEDEDEDDDVELPGIRDIASAPF